MFDTKSSLSSCVFCLKQKTKLSNSNLHLFKTAQNLVLPGHYASLALGPR